VQPASGGAATGWRVWFWLPRLTGAGKGPERVCPKKFPPFAQIQFIGKGVPEGGVQRGKLAGKTGFAAHRPPRSGINGMTGSAILPDTVWAGASGQHPSGSHRAVDDQASCADDRTRGWMCSLCRDNALCRGLAKCLTPCPHGIPANTPPSCKHGGYGVLPDVRFCQAASSREGFCPERSALG
jgi:hypothetical protein